MDEPVPCKKCRHIRRDWSHFPFSFSSQFAWKCIRIKSKKETIFDPISGKTSIEEPKPLSCVSARSKYGECGVEGKFWEPKSKKNFLVYLKRI